MTAASWFHSSKTIIKRSAGRSVVAAAAYRTGASLQCDREMTTHDYTRKRGVVDVFTTVPEGKEGLEWAHDIERLTNAMEAHEKRKDSQLGHEWTIALPSALDDTERADLSRDMAQTLSDLYGVAVIGAVHEPAREGDQRNHHVHLLFTTREVEADGRLGAKVTALTGIKTGPEEVRRYRGIVADLINEALEDAGSDERVDARSFAARGMGELEPTTHLGPAASAIERRGDRSERGDINREIIEERLRWQMEQSAVEITPEIERDLAARFEGWQTLERGAVPDSPPLERAVEGVAANAERGDEAQSPMLDRAAPADTSEQHRGWRRLVDRVRAFQARAAELWHDQTSGGEEGGYSGLAARLVDRGRKLIDAWRHPENPEEAGQRASSPGEGGGEGSAPKRWADRLLEQGRALWGNERGGIPADDFDRMALDWQPAAEPEGSGGPVEPEPPDIDGPDIE